MFPTFAGQINEVSLETALIGPPPGLGRKLFRETASHRDSSAGAFHCIWQLWVIDSSNPNPVDAGVFSVVDEKGQMVYKFTPKASVQKAAKFAVSIEKKGGAEKPTVDQIVLIGG